MRVRERMMTMMMTRRRVCHHLRRAALLFGLKKLINQPKVVRKVVAVMQRHWGALRNGTTIVTVTVAMAIEDSIGRGSS